MKMIVSILLLTISAPAFAEVSTLARLSIGPVATLEIFSNGRVIKSTTQSKTVIAVLSPATVQGLEKQLSLANPKAQMILQSRDSNPYCQNISRPASTITIPNPMYGQVTIANLTACETYVSSDNAARDIAALVIGLNAIPAE